MRRLGQHIAESGRAFAAVFHNAGLRRLQAAWAASVISHWGFLVAVSVYAYGQGGEEAVGLIFLLRLVPTAIVSPFAGVLADRYRRERVLFASAFVRCLLVAGAALGVAADVAAPIVYGLAIAATIANAPFRSAQAALTPTLARTPSELTASNAVASTIESLAFFTGPAVAGLLLAVTDIEVVFALTAAALGLSSFLVLRIRAEAEAPKGEVEASTILSECLAGFSVIWRHKALRVLIGLLTAQTFVAGLVMVYIVIVAIETLDLGDSGVGYLNAAFGVGALVGALGALGLTGARRLSPAFILGIALWGLPLIVLGLRPSTAAALLLFAVVGIGNSLVDVAGFTLVQRAVPDEVLARVFGVIQFTWLSSVGIGGLLAPVMIDAFEIEDALVITGIFLPVLALLLGRAVMKIDAEAAAPEAQELRVLAGVPIFAPLPGAALEHIAGRLVPLRIDPGTVVVREGDAGDRFYVIVEGEVEVTAEGTPVSTLGPGGYFGEIALLKDVPRTATVAAKTPLVLYALEREDFLATVTGHAPSAKAAESVISSRLSGLQAAAGSPMST
ncbi:MAG TPA: MFS transporter [Gaiellaceae bacterium]|nr:MFS transporter [Gaiellaceae bacterium]